MSFPHEVIAAYPTGGGNPDPGLIRDMCTRRFAYALASSEAASDFVAKDPVSAIAPLYLIQNGTLYAYDATDSVTAPSAVCLVTNDSCRYKSGTIEPPYSVLTYSTTAQPADVDVSDGDTFLLPIGATGADWAGKAGQIAMRVGAKWHFATNPIGRRLYVEDEDRFYYRNDSGVWVTGNGTLAFAANSIPITAVIGAKASFTIKVENQTTNAPPASPVAPVAYIIGPSPTGAWAGLAGQLAFCLVDGTYTYIVPDEGDEVWDKTTNNKYVFNGTAWVSSVGAIIAHDYVETLDGTSTSDGGSGYYSSSTTVAPTTATFYKKDLRGITWIAKRAGAKLRMRYEFSHETVATIIVGVIRGSETTALKWSFAMSGDNNSTIKTGMTFVITATDQLSHTYYPTLFYTSGTAGVIAWRYFEIEEFA